MLNILCQIETAGGSQNRRGAHEDTDLSFGDFQEK